MAPHTRSASAAADVNPPAAANAGPSAAANTGSSVADTGPPLVANTGPSTAATADAGSSSAAAAANTNMVTLTQAQYEAMQAQIAAAQLVPGPASVAPSASGNSATPSAPVPTAFEYRGKGPKPDKYYGRSRGKYNTFIDQCESNFILEGNNTDAGQVAYGAAFLAGTPSKVWKIHRKYNLPPTTWIEFKKVVYAKLGDVTNIQQTLTEEWHRAQQAQDELVQAYAARLDKLTEDIGKVLTEEDRAEKFRIGLRYSIKTKIDEQASQAITYHNLVAQAQRIETHERGFKPSS